MSRSEYLAALLRAGDIFELGERVPEQAECGRPRMFPGYMYVLYCALLSVHQSNRKVEAELGTEATWSFVCAEVRKRFPGDPSMWLNPNKPIRRYHYDYMRNAHLVDDLVLPELLARFRELATEHARDIGMCDPEGAGSLTHPALERVLYADGKVVTPLYKAKPGTTHVDTATGEIREVRSDPDAHVHITGSGEMAYGNKFVLVNCRLPDPHSRVIVDVRSVPDTGGEAREALESLRLLAPLLPGAQGVLYDGAFRGVHNQVVLHDLGLIPIVPVTAKSGGKRQRQPRVERTVRVEQRVIETPTGTETIQLYTCMGAVGVGEIDECGDVVVRPMERTKVLRRPNSDGTYRWYVECRLPEEKGVGVILVRLDITDDDVVRKFNRTEHLRAIPTDDPDWDRLYPRRSDAESINRVLDDTLWLRRAHSKGRRRQLFELMGFALMTNALAMYRHGRSDLARAG